MRIGRCALLCESFAMRRFANSFRVLLYQKEATAKFAVASFCDIHRIQPLPGPDGGTPVDIRYLSALIALSPDVHLLRFLNELVAEVRMRNRDDALGALPVGHAL